MTEKSKYWKLTPKQIEMAIEYYEAGNSGRDIAKLISDNNITGTTILKYLKQKGVKIRSHNNKHGIYKLINKNKERYKSKLQLEMERWGFKTKEEMEKHFEYWGIRGRRQKGFVKK